MRSSSDRALICTASDNMDARLNSLRIPPFAKLLGFEDKEDEVTLFFRRFKAVLAEPLALLRLIADGLTEDTFGRTGRCREGEFDGDLDCDGLLDECDGDLDSDME
mmetsp:Transcript_23034/g.32198  ORF Transcript_23034/g.32198 Transcript_23034/m.32198 type:complete len:106 (-) Transcript_23034:94-411(-)